MVNASWLGALTQSETAKYFKWIIVINVFYLRYFMLQVFCSFMFRWVKQAVYKQNEIENITVLWN